MSYEFDWSVLITHRALLWSGIVVTLKVAVVSIAASLMLGSLIGVGRRSEILPLRMVCAAYTEFFRNIPLIVQLFFWYFAVALDSFAATVTGLSVYTSAYIAEVIRSGIRSIPATQTEAARSFGMTRYQTLRYVIVPQALMRVIPPLALEFINVVKNSSIAMTIGVTELTFQTQAIESQTFRGFEAATAVTALYVILALVVVLSMNALERAIRLDIKVG